MHPDRIKADFESWMAESAVWLCECGLFHEDPAPCPFCGHGPDEPEDVYEEDL